MGWTATSSICCMAFCTQDMEKLPGLAELDCSFSLAFSPELSGFFVHNKWCLFFSLFSFFQCALQAVLSKAWLSQSMVGPGKYMSGISCLCLIHMQEVRYDHSFVDCKFGWEFETSLSQDLRLIAELPHTSHTHGHTNECMRHNTELLDETNTATELRGSALTSWGTLATGDTTTMAFPKEEFPPPHGCKSMEIVCALNLLIAKRRTSTQYVPFLKSLLWLFWCLNHRPPRFGTEARTITPPSLLFDFLELNSYTMSIIELVPSLLTKTFFVLRRTGLASIGHSTCYRPCFAERVAGIKVTITYLYF